MLNVIKSLKQFFYCFYLLTHYILFLLQNNILFDQFFSLELRLAIYDLKKLIYYFVMIFKKIKKK